MNLIIIISISQLKICDPHAGAEILFMLPTTY